MHRLQEAGGAGIPYILFLTMYYLSVFLFRKANPAGRLKPWDCARQQLSQSLILSHSQNLQKPKPQTITTAAIAKTANLYGKNAATIKPAANAMHMAPLGI